MEVHRGDVVLLDVNLANQPCAVETPIADACAGYTKSGITGDSAGVAVGELKISRRLTDVVKNTDALQTKPSDLKGLTGGDKGSVRATGRQVHVAVIGADQGNGITGAVIRRMPHYFHSKLIVANAEHERQERRVDTVVLGGWLIVIVGINAGDVGQSQDTLFGQQVIELELAKLEVESEEGKT